MGSLGWAVVLSVLSAASYAGAAVAQQRLAEHGQRGLARWALALSLTVGGVVLHIVALNFGTVAVVQALGTLTLLFALPIWALRYHQRIGTAAWVEACLTVAGLVLVMVLSVESTEPALLTGTAARTLALVTGGIVVALVAGGWLAGPRLRAVLLAAAAGTAFGIASVLSKAVMTAFTSGGLAEVAIPVAALVVGLSVGGYALGQLSYRGAGLAAPLATVSVANPVVAAITGVIVFDESFRFGVLGLLAVALAGAVMTAGVIGLARRTTTPPAQDAAASGESRTAQRGTAASR